jgi:hypothetical protein
MKTYVLGEPNVGLDFNVYVKVLQWGKICHMMPNMLDHFNPLILHDFTVEITIFYPRDMMPWVHQLDVSRKVWVSVDLAKHEKVLLI